MIQIKPAEKIMRPVLYLVPLLALTACATPREACINQALRDKRIVDALVVETQQNIARGYALQERQDTRTIRDRCTGRTPDGEEFRYRCDRVDTFTTSVPVAINLDDERAKLESLLERQARNRTESDQAIAQCIAVHPE